MKGKCVKMVCAVLENDPLTNAGYGSNLTLRGAVEMDAAVMDGKTLNYGGCGAIRRVKNPIDLAYDICMKQAGNLPMGLVPPSLLVGQGGYYHAKAAGLELVKNKDLVTNKAQWQLEKYKNVLENVQNGALDTVGAVCIDDSGHVAAAASSGE